ncbi:MAG: 16S rRNA (adenine(1518)-N(6)/adenine(1519)-N(6))-dimethyltransferase RsmA [Solirubrobacteraceae bacterium]
MSAVAEGPVQPSLRRMRRFGVRPDRELGQNFLIDSNILGVIGRAAALEPQDVVLEVGGGLGVLSEYLAQHTAHVHVVEIDERLREALCDATDSHANVTVHWADAMTLDLAALQPAPDKVVANLPYGVAASVLLRSIEELPGVRTWVAMVQREVGERLAAGPVGGGGAGRAGPQNNAYGVPSVLAQLACEVEVLRAIPRTVFFPVPNVDSVLVGMRRREPSVGGAGAGGAGVSPALRALVAGAFAHRRKTLSGSLGLAGGSSSLPPRSREQVRDALTRLGHPADARAERLSPEDFRALARLLEL